MAKGGKRAGAGRKKGLGAEAYRKHLIEEIVKHKAPLVKALIDKGIAGDVQALKEINDRGLGKAPQGLDLTTKGEKVAGVVFLPSRGENTLEAERGTAN